VQDEPFLIPLRDNAVVPCSDSMADRISINFVVLGKSAGGQLIGVYVALDEHHVEVWSLEQRDGHLVGLLVCRGIVVVHLDIERLDGAQRSACRLPVQVAER